GRTRGKPVPESDWHRAGAAHRPRRDVPAEGEVLPGFQLICVLLHGPEERHLAFVVVQLDRQVVRPRQPLVTGFVEQELFRALDVDLQDVDPVVRRVVQTLADGDAVDVTRLAGAARANGVGPLAAFALLRHEPDLDRRHGAVHYLHPVAGRP